MHISIFADLFIKINNAGIITFTILKINEPTNLQTVRIAITSKQEIIDTIIFATFINIIFPKKIYKME